MRLLSFAALCVLTVGFPESAYPVFVSGVMLYTTDDLGNPAGWDETRQDFGQSQLWRTALGGIWHGLGLLPGLPPDSLGGAPLNGADFTVEIPLVEGANDFTVIGEPGGYTERDVFTALAVNLYLDGALAAPKVSAVFPRDAPPEGASPWPNQAPRLYGLSIEPAPTRESSWTFEDGEGFRVWVSRASFHQRGSCPSILCPPTHWHRVALPTGWACSPSSSRRRRPQFLRRSLAASRRTQ